MERFNYRNVWFAGFTAVVIAIFFSFHHPGSPNKVIAGDGFGYYAYLPAKFIYSDTALNFQWFPGVFNANYPAGMSADPLNNFMVPYKDKSINMYYPGQSFLQLPFFFMAHAAAKIFHYPADGYSAPYQMFMGFSAVFYTLLGLYVCGLLILKLSGSRNMAMLIPVLVFFGTNLFTFSVYAGGYTHCYSFCFITLCYYFAWRFFNEADNKLLNVLFIAFCAITVVFLRPVNIILLSGLLYFVKPFSLKQLLASCETNKVLTIVALLLSVFTVWYNLGTMYTQTQSFFVNTYAGNKFYFNRWDHVWRNVAGFQHGILWYTPLMALCFFTVLLCYRNPRVLLLLAPLFGMILLYSFWWFWNIINRTLVDLTVLVALLLMHLFMGFNRRTATGKVVLVLALLCIPFYQLKAYQIRKGILNGYYTYKDYYFDYFFRIRTANVFPVNPAIITHRKGYLYDFESGSDHYITDKNKYRGKRSATLNDHIDYACHKTFQLPFLGEAGFHKIRASFWYYRTEEMKNLHFTFALSRHDTVLQYFPSYIDGNNSVAEKWDYKEFGIDMPPEARPGDTFSVYFWNAERKNEVFIDDLRVEFIVTDGSDEMTMDE